MHIAISRSIDKKAAEGDSTKVPSHTHEADLLIGPPVPTSFKPAPPPKKKEKTVGPFEGFQYTSRMPKKKKRFSAHKNNRKETARLFGR